MQVLYTGATKPGMEQLDSNLSLGGFVSNSLIPNASLSNIFSATSTLSIQNKIREARMIALKNNDGDIITNIKIKINVDIDSICKYKIAFVNPTLMVNDPCFEKIVNSKALPYYATFQDIKDNDIFNISLLSNQAYLGIWLLREYNYESADLKKKNCIDWGVISDTQPPVVTNQQENLQFTIDYTIGEPSSSSSNSSSNSWSTSSSNII